MSMRLAPPWALLHVPHDSRLVPAEVRSQFCVSDEELLREILRMTDHHTAALFGPLTVPGMCISSPVSRLVVDCERYAIDREEPMTEVGMGVIYTNTSEGKLLRRDLRATEREALLATYYLPHHQRLEFAVSQALANFGRALIIDCHSFASVALPYENSVGVRRPGICLGTDSFHSPDALVKTFEDSFTQAGYDVAIDSPFAGSMVPNSRLNFDTRVSSIMVEVNRALYCDEVTGAPSEGFEFVALSIRGAILRAIDAFG